MNILVIGNGFDLAHGLPTKYMDFLEWIVAEFRYWEYSKKRGDRLPNIVKSLPLKLNIPSNKKQKKTIFTPIDKQVELWECINNNSWLEYFLQCDMHGNENWIDFESEISKVIRPLNKIINNLEEVYTDFPDTFFEKKFINLKNISTYKDIRNILVNDLYKLIRAFEIYLTEYIEKIEIKVISPNINNIIKGEREDWKNERLAYNKVLSFNYTNIYEKVYLKEYDSDTSKFIDYIHGKADIRNNVDTNNMVLGIDEYLSPERKNKEIDFIAFKKYYQRIYKGTGCMYKEWVDEIREDYYNYMRVRIQEEKIQGWITDMQTLEKRLAYQAIIDRRCKKHNLYIFGHSLDITDKDILRELILNDNVYTTIFYPVKEELERKIANLVKVIGQDELIRRTGGSTKTIEFKLQEPMVEST